MAYLDASALTRLILEEPGHEALEEALAGWGRRVSSRLATVEVLRAVRRHRPVIESEARRRLSMVALIAPSDGILMRAAVMAPPQLRSIDAIHISTALRLERDLGAFITYDERQRRAAAGAGLPTLAPA